MNGRAEMREEEERGGGRRPWAKVEGELNKIGKYIYETLGAQGKTTKQYPGTLKLLEEEKEEEEERKRKRKRYF